VSAIVDLDAACGRYLTYRDLIECGNTWRARAASGTPIDNLPRAAASVAALRDLCVAVIDPLVDQFGPVIVTYGFASARLVAKVPGRIAPRLDQHASCEIDSTGRLVCPRRGAAVDLFVKGHPATEVARWIAAHTPYDRLYLYGDERPIHVSYGPEANCVAFEKVGRVPRRIRL
jgi:hypothetical protein